MKLDYYVFADGVFSFYTAQYGSWAHDKRIVFRVRKDRTPSIRAKEKQIQGYDSITSALPYEVKDWLKFHPDYPVLTLPQREEYVNSAMNWFDGEIRTAYEIKVRSLLSSGAVDIEETGIYVVAKAALLDTSDECCKVTSAMKKELANLRKI